MKALITTTAIPSTTPFQRPPVAVKAPFVCCLRLEGNGNAEVSEPPKSMGRQQRDIWRLFKEAQENILYLNEERVKAIEQLNRKNKEQKLLLDKIEQLAAEKLSHARPDKMSFCWEMLLRIDSMVLAGDISTGEASDLRRLITDYKVGVADVFTDAMQKKDAEFLAELRDFSNQRKKNAFHIVHICTEMEPLVSIGSLASYITGLSRALQRKGHLAEVILPKYASMDLDEVEGLHLIAAESYSYFSGQLHANKIWTGVVHGVGVTLIEPIFYSSFFDREMVYGYPDDFERFSYFSRASLDYIVKSGKKPDVLHIHNWETAIVGLLFWEIFASQGLEGTRILLTCHDFNLQSLEQPEKLALCGLDPSRLHRPDRLEDNNNTYLVNILKGGIVYSNKIVMMSSIHSKSKVIHSLSQGLEATLNIHKDKLVVSPSGYDSSTWDPSKDRFLPKNYSVEDMRGKNACKLALQHYLGLAENDSSVVVGCVFSEDSDVDVKNLKAIFRSDIGKGVQFIIMGINNNPTANEGLVSFEEDLKPEEDIRFIPSDDEALSHLVWAGSDIILCQSFHDPVFQVPLKALRYGAAPIVITPNNRFRHSEVNEDETTKSSRFLSSAFGNMSISDALNEMKKNPSKWKKNIIEGMAMDFSWDAECCDIHVSAYTDIKKL
ncbi:hypothetical protein UlMin_038889 [Ulmus minor]